MSVIGKAAARLDIAPVAVGDDLTLTFTVTENAVAYAWAGATVTKGIYQNGVLLTTNWAVTNTVNGTLILALTDTNTTALGPGTFEYFVAVTKGGGTDTWLAGTLTLSAAAQSSGSSSASATLAITTAAAVNLAITGGAIPATAAQVLALLVTVDGAGSLLDADKLDGVEGAVYAAATAQVASDLAAHIIDAVDSHDASSISVLDTGNNWTGGDVETVLAEIPSRYVSLPLIDAKGDMLIGTGADAVAKLAAPADGSIRTADSAQATGWTDITRETFATDFAFVRRYVQVVTGLTRSATEVNDDAVWQAAIDALAGTGGELVVPGADESAPFWLGSVDLPANVTLRGHGAAIKSRAGMSTARRGMFHVIGLQPANLHMTGEFKWDLNRSAYSDADARSVLYALRSTSMFIDGGQGAIEIDDSSENAFLFRNCAHIEAAATFDNIYNAAIECGFYDAAADGYSAIVGAPVIGIPSEYEHYVWEGKFSRCQNNLAGAGNGNGVLMGTAAPGIVFRRVRAKMICEANAHDFTIENNNATSWAENVKVETISDSPTSGSIHVVNVKNNVELIAEVRNPGDAATRTGGAEIYGIIVTAGAGTVTDDVTVDLQVTDDRASSTDYTTRGLKINYCKNLVVRSARVKLAANASQASAPIAVDLTGVTESVQVGPLDLRITNAPAGTIAVKAPTTGAMHQSGSVNLVGWGTNWSAAPSRRRGGSMARTGQVNTADHTTRATLATSLNNLYLVPFDVDNPVTLIEMGVEVTVVGAIRTVADGVLNSTTTLTSATIAFVAGDVGKLVIGTGIPVGTRLASVTNGTTAIMSAAATTTASGVTVTLTAAVRVGIFKDSPTFDFPDTVLLDAGLINVGASTGYVAAPAVSQLLLPGRYYIGAASQGAVATLRASATFTRVVPRTTAAAHIGATQNAVMSVGSIAGPFTTITTAGSTATGPLVFLTFA